MRTRAEATLGRAARMRVATVVWRAPRRTEATMRVAPATTTAQVGLETAGTEPGRLERAALERVALERAALERAARTQLELPAQGACVAAALTAAQISSVALRAV